MARVFLLFVLAGALCSVEARRRRPRPHDSRELDNEVDELKNQVQALEARLSSLESTGSAGTGAAAAHAGCPSEKVQLHFHGEGEKADHGSPGDTYVHVRLGLDMDDFHKRHGFDHHDDDDDDVHEHTGHCEMQPIGSANVHGFVHFSQLSNESTATAFVDLGGFPESGVEHGIHVHETGDISDGFLSLKGHYDFRDPDSDVGDIGPIRTDSGKTATITLDHISLSLLGPYSILGRSVIVHDKHGDPMAYCIIGVGKESFIYHDDDHSHDDDDDYHGFHRARGHRRHRVKKMQA